METLFKGIFDSAATTTIRPGAFLLCMGAALVLGLCMALCYMYKSHYTKSFLSTLALLPPVVCVVIMLVNGNVGTGVAVAGAFSLVRFRSAPGTAREICALFLAMAAGLILGMGYIGYGVLFTAVMCGAFLLYTRLSLGETGKNQPLLLHITVPEDLNYVHAFDDIFAAYTREHKLVKVKSTNMGSLFRLSYHITLTDTEQEKAMLDALRCRNGNLELCLCPVETTAAEL